MNGQWSPGHPAQQPPLQQQKQQHQTRPPPPPQQQQQMMSPLSAGGMQPGGMAGTAAVAGGGADVLPSSEELEAEATKRGMPPLEQCLRRCPRCLQGVPIRSMMCQHCQYLIPVSAKAMARREMKEQQQQQQQQGVANGGGTYGARPEGASGGVGGGGGGGGGGGESESDERPRQKRKRQSTKKGMTTATAEELAELDEGLSEDEQVSWRKSSGQRRAGRVQTDKRKKKCPSCSEMNPMSVKVCRECDTVFPVGARLDSAVTSEELREKFSFEPEFNKDGTPMIEKILGRRPIVEPDPEDEDAISVLIKHHRHAHYGHHYECLVKFRGVAYNKVEWMSDLEIRSLGMVASRMLTNYIKTRERDVEKGEVEEDEYYDPAYLEVEKVLDAKVFKMEYEVYPDDFDPDAFGEKEEEGEDDGEGLPDSPAGLVRTPPPDWEDDGVAMIAGRRTREDPEWRPMTRCRHVLSTLMEDDLSVVFHEPVDLDAYPTYMEKVDEPMDFETINRKLINWEYRRNDPAGFQRDLRLVFTNCKVFNKFGSTIWYIADYLQAKFERLFQAWVMNFGDKDDRIPWEEPRARPWEEWCRKCLGPELKRNRMLLCDTCDAEYHCHCLGLSSIPKGQWLCPICEVMLHKGQTLFSHQTEVEKAKRSQMPQPTMNVVDVQKYLVKWSSLSYQGCTWETREDLNNDEAIDQFHKLNDHPPLSPPMSEEELGRCLSQTNHDVLPALLEPSSVLEHNAQIYSQIRAFHFLRHGMSPPASLLAESGKSATIFAEQKMASVKVKAGPSKGEEEAKEEEELRSILFDMKQSLAHGKKYDAPPRADIPALPMHEQEYEVTLPKEHGSLFMNIHQQSYDGIIYVSVSSLCPRMPPRQHEPTPVMRSHLVAVGDVITAIDGMPMLGFDTSVVATVLQNLPACVTLRLVKHGVEYLQRLAQTQAEYSKKLGSWTPDKPFKDTAAVPGDGEGATDDAASTSAAADQSGGWQVRIKPVDDEFTRAASSGGVVGEAMIEAEHRVIEELGQKRRLLMAVNESKTKPTSSKWSDVGAVYSLTDYVYAHENMGHVESMASRRHDPRAKPIEQLHPETGEVVKVWPSMTAASVALLIGVSALSACVNGITAQAGRWKWRFASKHTATALKMGVYRKHRVADMSGGPGTYLEPEAAAAQIASGKRGDYDSDDGFGDAVITRAEDGPSSSSAKASKAAAGGNGTQKEAAAAPTAEASPHGPENGNSMSPAAPIAGGPPLQVAAAAAGAEGGQEVPSGVSAMDVEAPDASVTVTTAADRVGASPSVPLTGKGGGADGDGAAVPRQGEAGDGEGEGLRVEDDEDDIDVDIDVDQGAVDPQRQMQVQIEQDQRQKEERRLAGLDGDQGGTNGGGGSGGGGMYGSGGDGNSNPPYDYNNMGVDYRGHDAAGDGDAEPGMEGDHARPRGRPRSNSFEDNNPNPSVASASSSEEEVDWEDSNDEDMDAATAEALEQARIGMARAAARDLRESRATRAQMMDWPYKDGKVPDFKNTNELRDYQRRGVNWMVSCWKKKRRGCILADEMGLGKTVQVVAMLNYVFANSEREKGPFLVVVPLTTIEHWRREVEAWTDMNLCMYHDNGGRDMRDLIREYEWYYSGRSKRVLKFHVLVTTYDDVITDAEMLAQVPWRAVVVDEAHRMRNKNSALLGCLQQVVHNGMNVHAYQHRVLMTGTPMQNIKEELWPLMNFIDQSNFPDLQRFQDKYCKGEPGHEVDEARALRRRLKPYMLRRRKEDVTKDIPPKEETIIDVELTMVQKKYYRAIYERNHSVLNKVGAGAGKAPSLMNIQMELRKCCNHPFMVRGVEDHEVDNIVGTMMEETQKADPDDSASRLDHQKLRQLQLEKGLIHTSGKMVLLDKLLPKLKSEGHKVLIFSQFIGMLDMVQEFLALRGHKHERLDGRTTGNERQKSIDRFNREPNSFVFLLSTRAGGVGINLTAADTCIIYDSDWNPQNDVQAMARCHRIGQTKSVMVYRLITRNCFESEMFNRASMKLGLEQAVLGDAAGSLKPRDMEDLLKKGAYALTQMDEVDAMREFQDMDIDSILERKSRVLVEEPTAKGLGDDSDNDEESDKEDAPGAHRGDQHKVTWRSFGGGAKTGPSLEDPDFWRKVMPDVMTPESMVSKLDEFENFKEGEEPAKKETDGFMEDLAVMVVGLRKSNDEDEREKGVQLLVRVTCKRELFSEEQCAEAKRWELELQGTRLRQAARQQDMGETSSPEQAARSKGRTGGRKSIAGRKFGKDDDYEPKPKISAAPGGGGGKSSSGKSSGGRDHNMDMCARCEDGGVIMMCDGPCQRSFHPICLGMDDKPDEDPWMCNRCSSKVQKCLQCGEKGPEMDSHNRAIKVPGGVSRCQLSSCGRFYHKECLDKMSPKRVAYSKEGNFKCPQHFCNDCGKTSTNLGPRTLSKCLRCAKAYCPDCLTTARYVKKGKWMVCSDHEWTPQDIALFEEQQLQKKYGAEKGKRKPKPPLQPSVQFTKEQEAALLDARAPVCYFCKGDKDDASSVQGAFIRPPFVQKTIKHGDLPIWLHTNCMLYTPECFVEYPVAATPAASGKPSSTSSESSSRKSPSTTPTPPPSSPPSSGGSKNAAAAESPAKTRSAGAADAGNAATGDDGDWKPVYYGVDEARKRVALKCTSCRLQGALIGCHSPSCQTSTHYACAIREGWEFGEPDADGKLFLCIMHRKQGQVRFERKTPAKKSSKKSASKTSNTGSKGKGSSSSSGGTGGSSAKGKSKARDRSSSIQEDDDDDGGGGDGGTSPVRGAESEEDAKPGDTRAATPDEIKTPRSKKSRRAASSGAGGSGAVKTEGGTGGSGGGSRSRPGDGPRVGGGGMGVGPPPRVGKDGELAVQCACGKVEREGQGYVQCQECQEWQHFQCAGACADSADVIDSFVCRDCVASSSRRRPSSGSGPKRKPSLSGGAQSAAGEDGDSGMPGAKRSKSTPSTKAKARSPGSSAGVGPRSKSGTPKKAAAGVGGEGGTPWTSLEDGWDELDSLQKKAVVMNTLAYLAKEDPLGYFAEPVDASLVPGYKDVVSHPMDFSTIKKRQQKGRYSKLGFSKLWEDIATVYQNAQLYNQDESDCFIKAQKGLDVMRDRMKKAIREAAQPTSSSTSSSNGTTTVSASGGGSGRSGGSHHPRAAQKKHPPKGGGRGAGGDSAKFRDSDDDEDEEEEEDEEESDDDSEYEESSAASKRRRAKRASPSRPAPGRSSPRGFGRASRGGGRDGAGDNDGVGEDRSGRGADGVPAPHAKRRRR